MKTFPIAGMDHKYHQGGKTERRGPRSAALLAAATPASSRQGSRQGLPARMPAERPAGSRRSAAVVVP
ncbi:MAG TPA: hypothetical protein VFP80_13790, partial [Thermoanaerobaculia bacterium]|nr:hypothetical protein [Thermoanaerobaculia bacterium]